MLAPSGASALSAAKRMACLDLHFHCQELLRTRMLRRESGYCRLRRVACGVSFQMCELGGGFRYSMLKV